MKVQKLLEGTTPDETITITLGVTGNAKKQLARLLDEISSFCSMGASRSWGIVDGDKGEGSKIDFDGDGADQLVNIKINGKPLKSYL